MSKEIKRKQEITERYNTIEKIILSRQIGDVITFDEIEDACGINRGHQNWSGFKARLDADMLKRHKIRLLNIRDTGYRIVKDEEMLKVYPKLRARKQSSQSRKAVAELESIDMSKLSINQQRLRLMEMDRHGEILKTNRQVIRTIADVCKTETNPRVPPTIS